MKLANRVRSALLCTLLFTFALPGGCMYIPIPGPSGGMIRSEGSLKFLIGSYKTEVEEELGPPVRAVQDPDEAASYFLYEGWTTFGYGAVTDGRRILSQGWASRKRQCTVLTFDKDEQLTAVKLKYVSYEDTCQFASWTPDEISGLIGKSYGLSSTE